MKKIRRISLITLLFVGSCFSAYRSANTVYIETTGWWVTNKSYRFMPAQTSSVQVVRLVNATYPAMDPPRIYRRNASDRRERFLPYRSLGRVNHIMLA